MSHDETVDAENSLFTTHPVLNQLKPYEWGYKTLTNKIVEFQSRQVDEWIPEVKKTIRQKIRANKAVLAGLDQPPETPEQRRVIVIKLASTVEKRLDALICARDTTIPEINVAARTQEFAMAARLGIDEELPKWLDVDYGHVITPLVKETLGYTMSNFLSDPIFRGELRKNCGTTISWTRSVSTSKFTN